MTTESTECCKSSESTECCKSSDSAECCQSCPHTNLGLIYGSLLLRVWLAVRAIQTGVEKYAGMKGSDQPISIDGKVNDYGLTSATNVKEYALSHYHGVPEALMKKFTDEPLMLKWALPLYDKVLGPALIVLGLIILSCIFIRPALFLLGLLGSGIRSVIPLFRAILEVISQTALCLLGLLYISLTWGLVLIKEDSGVAWLGIHMIMIVMALWFSKYKRLCVLKKC